MPFDARDFVHTMIVSFVVLAAILGGMVTLAVAPQHVGWATLGLAVAILGPISELVRSVPGYIAEGDAEHPFTGDDGGHRASHTAGQDHRRSRPGVWARLYRYRACPSGFGHCVHPRGGDQQTDLGFTDTGVEHVDCGAWCCECSAWWRFTPVPVPACRVCDR